ncbi:MAG: Mth938-like domain-containing protein [Pirellulales bacterium]|jgi:hypothetical protein|nr:Mth938-like domain-containing protein [Pirellulales bacterium]|tara:strand:- start:217 stop:597 length:381 start_codon:yes stop_codon:yes gene_type:complete
MFQDNQGPIESFEFGKYTINGREHMKGVNAGKDIRLMGDEVSEWAERDGHGLTPDMITGVYDCDVEVLIIGNGVHQYLQCPDIVKEAISLRGIPELQVLATPEACKEYNSLHRQGRRVALLAHGTC